MSGVDVSMLVQRVLENDLNPPSEDYDTYEYAASIARGIDDESASLLIRAGLEALPASLAESFLDGILDNVSVGSLNETLFAVLPRVRELTSAGVVVHLLVHRCHIGRVEIVKRLLAGINSRRNQDAQDAYAYALLIAAGQKTEENPVREAINDDQVRSLISTFSKSGLTAYSRAIFDRFDRTKGN
jgi:hypothetical protein